MIYSSGMISIMKIKIIPNPKKPWALKIAKSLIQLLTLDHIIVTKNADLTICIGGDGTVLYANHRGRLDGIVLGIGGDKSYICQLHNSLWTNAPKLIQKKKFFNLMTFQCLVGQKSFSVLNDVVIHANHYRVAEMELFFNNTKHSFEGDGMIISTPLGSAGYAYSAGGDNLSIIERKISLVPICPYRRSFTPKLLPDDNTVEVLVGDDCALIIDGIFIRSLRKGEKITVKKGVSVPFFEGVGTW